MTVNGLKEAIVIGAGAEAVYAVECAKAAGYHVTALDGNPDAKGAPHADASFVCDIRYPGEVLALLEKNGIKPDISLPVPIGRYLTTTGAVNDALGLTGVSHRSAQLVTDKYAFHETLSAKGLRGARLLLLPEGTDERVIRVLRSQPDESLRRMIAETPGLPRELTDLTEGLHELLTEGFPVVMKPRFGSGSRSLFVCGDIDDLIKALTPLLPLKEDMIVESFVAGTEYGADAAFVNGELRLILLREKTIEPLPSRQCTGYRALSYEGENDALYKGAGELLKACGKALFLNDVLVHADLVRAEDGAFFPVELSARPSGHCISSALVEAATGVDMVRDFITLSECKTKGEEPPEDLFKPRFITEKTLTFDVSPEQSALTGEGYKIG